MKNALHILNICLLAIILYLYYLKINVGENIWIPGIFVNYWGHFQLDFIFIDS